MEFVIGRGFGMIPKSSLAIYFIMVAFSAIYFLYHFKITKFTVLLVIVFWSGFFYYLDYIKIIDIKFFKIILFVITFFVFVKNVTEVTSKKDEYINIIFILFSISYLFSLIINQYDLFTSFSQYSLKYCFPFLIYHGFKNLPNYPEKAEYIAKILVFIILAQLVLSIIKVLTIQMINEDIVGSIQLSGGGLAVVIPILGFFIFWLYKRGELNRKDWSLAVSFLFIAVASMKRTTVVLFPIFVYMVAVYVKKGVILKYSLKYIPIVLILFYIGVKTNYTLNPESSTWGRFDLDFVYRYAINYYFGTDNLAKVSESESGRGSSIFLLFNPSAFNFENYLEMLFGKDLVTVVNAEKGRFMGGLGYGIDHEGLMSAAPTLLYQLGYVGFLLYLLFIGAIISSIQNKRFKKIVFFWFGLDFFLYYNSTFLNPPMTILIIFIVFYSNIILRKESQDKDLVSFSSR